MITLGIETSCDETSCSILEDQNLIRSNVVSSSLFKHQSFGGVVPEIASRHSLEQIDFVFQKSLEQAKIKRDQIDLIAVTEGPGLIGSLFVGVCFAKALSYKLNVPMIGVNHLEAHLEAPFISDPKLNEGAKQPRKPREFVGLLVSGGHTSLTYHKGSSVKLLGETVDDAVGEAYDKIAKILELGFPGGPILDKRAKIGNPKTVLFTKPKQKNEFDFSFSGVKTAVLYYYQKESKKTRSEEELETLKSNIAASFQSAAVKWLVDKTLKAAKESDVKHIVVGGGVSANSYLREVLTEKGKACGYQVWFPHISLTGDNAAMIARRGYDVFRKRKIKSPLTLTGRPNLKIT